VHTHTNIHTYTHTHLCACIYAYEHCAIAEQANFKRQLEELAAEIAENEGNYDDLKRKHDQGFKR